MVNTKLYCLAAVIMPTGLFAFKSIHKFRVGVVLYVISYALAFASASVFALPFIQFNQDFILFTFISLILSILSIAVPIIFMRKYCIEYNQKIKKENMSVI